MAAVQAGSSGGRRPSTQPNHSYIGEYKRLESIGQGSFAIVYRCVHPSGSLVAIKSVHHTKLKGKLKANLFSEIDILKSVKHPHIVALIDILESTNHVHLVMELGWLGDLAMFMKKRDKLDTQPVTAELARHYPSPVGAGVHEVVARHFSKQLASALEYLRSKNLVHRDLKPQNLLLSPSPIFLAKMKPDEKPYEASKNSLIPAAGVLSMPILKIADFGFARVLEKTSLAETLCGSPLYMAPEILRYEKYDTKADLWSVGAILYELMAGKPPFRAQNHVDLLRKIEKSPDKVAFPRELVEISSDMKEIIRALMRKLPTERISWEDYFQCAVNKDEIPGLIEADRPPHRSGETNDAASDPNARRRESTYGKTRLQTYEATDRARDIDAQTPPRSGSGDTLHTAHPVARTSQTPSSVPLTLRGDADRQNPLSHLNEEHKTKSPQLTRPGLKSHDTAPVLRPERQAMAIATAAAMERRRSHQANPSTSAPKDITERARTLQRRDEKTTRDARDKAAQDIAFERDYVMVEKRAVEVNAFADELNASPQIQRGQRDAPLTPHQAAMGRRASIQNLPSTATNGTITDMLRPMPSPSRVETQQRRLSYERRYGPHQNSVTSIIGKALNSANVRLFGNGISPPLGKGASPPQGYNGFPVYPVANVSYSPAPADVQVKASALDEDTRTNMLLEEIATRSDVVYGFAEVKYKQLVPITPSNGNNLGMARAASDGPTEAVAGMDDDLTPDAIVAIAEEALVLYVKALALLNKTLDVAGGWWERRKRNPAVIEASSMPNRLSNSSPRDAVQTGARINGVVQWARNRFNECLEKSEFVARKLEDAQKKLPTTHDGHPSNHPDMTRALGVTISNATTVTATNHIHLSSGVTAEKLMYDRALEMSRTAAVNELMGEDLPGCDVSYVTAMRLLEAVLETDDLSPRKNSAPRREKPKEEEVPIDGIEEADRYSVTQIIESMRQRRIALSKKLAVAQGVGRRNSLRAQPQPPPPESSQVSNS